MDTDVYSYLNSPKDTRAQIYRPHVEGKLVALSFITIGEILFGAYKGKWGETRLTELRSRLRSVTNVPYDFLVSDAYAHLKDQLRTVGRSVADNDLWIAACAVRYSIPVVSNNRAHFDNIPGLVLISEAPIVKAMESHGTPGPPQD